MKDVFVIDHPLLKHKLTILRDRNTSSRDFRAVVEEMAMLMGYELLKDIKLKRIKVSTPLESTTGFVISGKMLTIIPILRAGLGLSAGLKKLLPMAKVGHIGIFRDPKTFNAIEYFHKLPPDIGKRLNIIVDPMLATGNSARAAIELLKRNGARKIKFLSIISCPEGIAEVRRHHPDVPIYTAVIDRQLNDHAYILPGLGDAGDRIFGTK
ncbi:MAG: uracil phosphoribosyltransferase [Elusimicrobia bacterium]|nr:uracil phosphoribosyltransferase [Elusimicrobiota bacterium]